MSGSEVDDNNGSGEELERISYISELGSKV